MKTGLALAQQPKIVLSLKMRQSLEILQLNALELVRHIQEASLENPLMELVESEPEKDFLASRLKEPEWPVSSDESNAQPASRGDEAQWQLDWKNPGESLYESLILQAAGMVMPDRRKRILYYLIDSLDENGYLRTPWDQLREWFPDEERELERALGALKQMDPPGVGACSLRECLLLQADRLGCPNPVLHAIISDHLELLAKNQLKVIAKKLNVTIEEVKAAREELLRLNPKPGNGFSSDNIVSYIRPDIFVIGFECGFQVILNDYNQPQIQINRDYLSIAAQSDGETGVYIKQKLKQAQELAHCIRQRKRTILKCTEAILARQQDFFRYGHGHIAPLALSDVAGMVDMHPSTVSRAISNKYLQCQWGVFQMNSFFSRAVNPVSENACRKTVLERIHAIVDEEDSGNPLRDQGIVDILKAEGITISRRTVAKYRDILRIPSSSRRKCI